MGAGRLAFQGFGLPAVHATTGNSEPCSAENGGDPQGHRKRQQAVASLREGSIGARCARSLSGVVLGGRGASCGALIRAGCRAAALGATHATIAALRAVAAGALCLAHDGVGREMPGGDVEIPVVHPGGDRLHLPALVDSVRANSIRIETRQVALQLQAHGEHVVAVQLVVAVEGGAVGADEADVHENRFLSLGGIGDLEEPLALIGGQGVGALGACGELEVLLLHDVVGGAGGDDVARIG